MSDITPEQLKRVAEYIGRIAHIRTFEGDYVTAEYIHNFPDGESYTMEETYNPLTNPEQLLELIEKLLSFEAVIDKFNKTYWVRIKSKGIHETGKTLAEAVIKAVLEMIND